MDPADAELRRRIRDLTYRRDPDCSCQCHLPGTRVVTVDGAPCCPDMAAPDAPPGSPPPPVGPNVSALRPKALADRDRLRRDERSG